MVGSKPAKHPKGKTRMGGLNMRVVPSWVAIIRADYSDIGDPEVLEVPKCEKHFLEGPQ